MTARILLTVFVALISISTLSAQVHKGPPAGPALRVGGMFESESPSGTEILPGLTALGPGDSICFTTYDYGTNGGACHNIIVYEDSVISVARMGQDETGSDARGTYFTCSDDYGLTWSPNARVESARSGWGNIAQFEGAGGVEVVYSHANGTVSVDAARCAGVWTQSDCGSGLSIWPRSATGCAMTFHGIGSCLGGGPIDADLYYTRSTDGGASFDVCDDLRIFTGGSGSNDADGFDIAAKNNNVYVCSTPAWDGTAGVGGGDVLLATSTDNGDTWTQEIIYDVPAEGELPEGEEFFMPDGSGQLAVDTDGNPHVFWGTYLGVGDATDTPVLFLSVDALIMHWSEATGVTIVAYADPDTTIGPPPGRDGNYASQPDAGVDSDGNIYVIYQRMIAEVDPNGNYYEHVFAAASADGGATWGDAVDVTPGTGFDAAFASTADYVDGNVHFVYNCDDSAGNSIQGNHLENQTAVMYHRVDKTTIPFPVVSVGEPDPAPARFSLSQNYPNPFNPKTTIRFMVPAGTIHAVSLQIFDVSGQEVATLVNERLSPGSHSVTWNAAGYPTGIYFYRLQSGEFAETKRLILLR